MGHGLEIIRLIAALHLIKLITRILLGVLWKVSYAFERVA
jgi:hypothetical protein